MRAKRDDEQNREIVSLLSVKLCCNLNCLRIVLDHSYMLELNTPTEPSVDELMDDQKTSTVLDLSKKGLKKVPKPDDAQHVKELHLDENLLQKIDNVDAFLKIEKVKQGHFFSIHNRHSFSKC